MARNLSYIAVMLVLLSSQLAEASSEQSVKVGEAERTYLLHVPRGLTTPAPIVVALHGGGSNAASMERYSRLSDTADSRGFVVAYPDGVGRVQDIHTWNAGDCCAYARRSGSDDVSFIAVVIDDIVRNHGGDETRVLVTGISNGAMMAYRFAALRPSMVTAVAAVAGSLEMDASEIVGPVPVLHFHGTNDEHVPVKGGKGSKSIATNSFRSLDYTVSAWIKVNRASPIPKLIPIPDLADDGMGTMRQEYAASKTNAPIVVYLISGGGHSWPGSPSRAERFLGPSTMDFDANEVMWEFFVSVVKERNSSVD